ncbi:MAG TPA: hypothetical protein DIU35_00165 [Candidatus Latescibacteria bacterium]|nr:hypothetical protein [Gemmatimonadota bacterium]HCR15871.1 hypothetical protein [Candidatus Latescibacterota bacterium]|tara:strand:- start:168 stop:404 length:237 start_codon:yes stop_codon:yes gene_type:complete
MLTEAQTASYKENGFLRLESVFDEADLAQMCAEMDWIFETWTDHDPANRQLDGHALGRLGWMVKGRCPKAEATLELKR